MSTKKLRWRLRLFIKHPGLEKIDVVGQRD